ncbi:MAG: lipid A biosynthesis lauroyl acyltransferase [Gammaproteobacteria bacterium]
MKDRQHSSNDRDDDLSLARFWSPRYWPTWLLLFWLRCSVFLPFRLQIVIGKLFGRVFLKLLRKTPRATRRNLEVCFPELSEAERDRLLVMHFEALGASLSEMAIGWFMPIERLRKLVRVEGLDNLRNAQEAGNGIILYVAHFTCLEVGVAMLEDLSPPCAAMYRPQSNAMIDVLVRRGRRRFLEKSIPRDNVRALVRELRNNSTVVYLPDHAYTGSDSVLLPFFGEPAVTNTATSRLAKISGATVLAYFFRRLDDDSGYVVSIAPPLNDFPSDDPAEDTRRMVEQLEDYIRVVPEQYVWTYRRFKGRPESYPDIYGPD